MKKVGDGGSKAKGKGSKRRGERENMSRIFSVRLPESAYTFLRETGDARGVSAGRLLRIILESNLEAYLGRVRYVDERQGDKILAQIIRWGDELHRLRTEVNRIGVSYRQRLLWLNNCGNCSMPHPDTRPEMRDVQQMLAALDGFLAAEHQYGDAIRALIGSRRDG